MLTINKPIKLQSAVNIISSDDDFYNKISGQYSMMTTQFTPKDLLLLLTGNTAEEDEPASMTTLVTQNQVSVKNGLTLEVLNNIVNRIIISQNTPFTYQDSVYISAMLNKAGINDVSLFMRQVHQLSEQNENIHKLTALYNTLSEHVYKSGSKVVSEPKYTLSNEDKSEEQPHIKERYFLHSDIYSRLKTADVYNTFASFMSDYTTLSNSVHKNEMNIAEQVRVLNQLELAQLRQNIIDEKQPMTLEYVQNHYERGDLLEAPENESQVFSQLASAVMMNIIDKTITLTNKHKQDYNSLILDFTPALQQSIENTFFRYQNYSKNNILHKSDIISVDESRNKLLSEEYNLLNRFIQYNNSTEIAKKPSYNVIQNTQDALNLTFNKQTNENETNTHIMGFEIKQTLREILLVQRITDGAGEVVKQAAEELGKKVAYLTNNQQTKYKKIDTKALIHTQNILPVYDLKENEITVLSEQFDKLDEVTKQTLETRYKERINELYRQNKTVSQSEIQKVIMQTLSTENIVDNLTQSEIANEVRLQNTLANSTLEVLEKIEKMSSELYNTNETISQNETQKIITQKEKTLNAVDSQTENVNTNEVNQQNILENNRLEVIKQIGQINSKQYTENEILGHSEVQKVHVQTLNTSGTVENVTENENINEVIQQNTLQKNKHEVIEKNDNTKFIYDNEKLTESTNKEKIHESELIYKNDKQYELESQENNIKTESQGIVLKSTQELIERLQHSKSEYEHLTENTSEKFVSAEHTLANQTNTEHIYNEDIYTNTNTLREQLDIIDKRNREMLEKVRNERIKESQQQRIQFMQSDSKRVINDALRAIDKPDEVINEVLKLPESKPKMLNLSPEAKTLLNQADEDTRRMLEAVMQYENNPSSITKFISQPPSALNMFTSTIEQQEIENNTHVYEPIEIDNRTKQAVSQLIPPVVNQTIKSYEKEKLSPIEFVHKTEQRIIDENLLEQIEKQKQAVKQITQTEVNEQYDRVDMQHIDQTTYKTIERTSEDVTELINRTMAKQLDVISDKVYKQMEKKLRMERARRGR